jgi:hypothetical protein
VQVLGDVSLKADEPQRIEAGAVLSDDSHTD